MMKKQAFNPYLPSWEYIPDGEPYVFGDRVYVYGSHDQFNGWVFCQGDYMGWSAPVDDLSDWRCEGVIYEKTQDPLNTDGAMCLYAPDVTQGPDGRYYHPRIPRACARLQTACCPALKTPILTIFSFPFRLTAFRSGERVVFLPLRIILQSTVRSRPI